LHMVQSAQASFQLQPASVRQSNSPEVARQHQVLMNVGGGPNGLPLEVVRLSHRVVS